MMKGTVNVRTVQKWFDKFRSGNTSLKEKDGRGRPTSVDNNQLRALVEANPKTTVRELSIELGVLYDQHRKVGESLAEVCRC
jgi:transposase